MIQLIEKIFYSYLLLVDCVEGFYQMRRKIRISPPLSSNIDISNKVIIARNLVGFSWTLVFIARIVDLHISSPLLGVHLLTLSQIITPMLYSPNLISLCQWNFFV